MTDDELPRMYTTEEVGARVLKGPDWVKRRLKGGEYTRVGRTPLFTRDQAEAFIKRFTVRPDVTETGPELVTFERARRKPTRK